MEKDRYDQHHVAYLVALSCLLLGLFCIAMAIYIFPYAMFKMIYHLPISFFSFVGFLKDALNLSEVNAIWSIWWGFAILGLLALLLAELLSNHLDRTVLDIEQTTLVNKKRRDKTSDEGMRTSLIIISVIALVFFFMKIIQWSISSNI